MGHFASPLPQVPEHTTLKDHRESISHSHISWAARDPTTVVVAAAAAMEAPSDVREKDKDLDHSRKKRRP